MELRGCKPQKGHAPIKVILPTAAAWLCEEMEDLPPGALCESRSELSPDLIGPNGSREDWSHLPIRPLSPTCTQLSPYVGNCASKTILSPHLTGQELSFSLLSVAGSTPYSSYPVRVYKESSDLVPGQIPFFKSNLLKNKSKRLER